MTWRSPMMMMDAILKEAGQMETLPWVGDE